MIYAISDLHLDVTKEKDMNVFGDTWMDYEKKIFENWKSLVKEDDLVLVPGDISWAMNLEEAYEDLIRIDELPGRKILLKGNHDYWWQSLNKINKVGFKSLEFLQNNSFIHEKTLIVGTRGWADPTSSEFKEADRKVFERELLRMDLSIKDNEEEFEDIIAIMHYPPFTREKEPNEFEEIFIDNKVSKVIYGHLHGKGLENVVEGRINGIDYYCASADHIDFRPIIIKE